MPSAVSNSQSAALRAATESDRIMPPAAVSNSRLVVLIGTVGGVLAVGAITIISIVSVVIIVVAIRKRKGIPVAEKGNCCLCIIPSLPEFFTACA